MGQKPHESSPAVRPLIIPPPVQQRGVEQLDSPIVLAEDTIFPAPLFARAILDERKRRMPQCIAHRGFKAKFPENTMLAFKKAVSAGATALETDIHLTKDDIVVLSHDADLKRCFGRKDRVVGSTWDDIKELRTLAPPHVPMPRLSELLEYLAEPELEHIWLLLDIKLDNDADRVMELIANTIEGVSPHPKRPWNERIILGAWAVKYLPLAAKYLPSFPVMHIGFQTAYARDFFETPHVGFNMLIPMLMAPGGKSFIRACQETYKRQILGWTVNDKDKMVWCIRRKFDGVITDDPELFLKTCEQYDEYSKEPLFPIGFRATVQLLRMYIMVFLMFWLWKRKLKQHPKGLIKKLPR